MALSKDEILELMTQAKNLGFATLEVDGIKMCLNKPTAPILETGANQWRPDPTHQPVPEMKPEEIVSPLPDVEEPSDEEILYYATPYYDELQAKKNLKTQQQKEDEEVRK